MTLPGRVITWRDSSMRSLRIVLLSSDKALSSADAISRTDSALAIESRSPRSDSEFPRLNTRVIHGTNEPRCRFSISAMGTPGAMALTGCGCERRKITVSNNAKYAIQMRSFVMENYGQTRERAPSIHRPAPQNRGLRLTCMQEAKSRPGRNAPSVESGFDQSVTTGRSSVDASIRSEAHDRPTSADLVECKTHALSMRLHPTSSVPLDTGGNRFATVKPRLAS